MLGCVSVIIHLQYLLCGLPAIDVDDWKKNTNYIDYQSSDDTIMWFWIVSNFMLVLSANHSAFSRLLRGLIMRHVLDCYSL